MNVSNRMQFLQYFPNEAPDWPLVANRRESNSTESGLPAVTKIPTGNSARNCVREGICADGGVTHCGVSARSSRWLLGAPSLSRWIVYISDLLRSIWKKQNLYSTTY